MAAELKIAPLNRQLASGQNAGERRAGALRKTIARGMDLAVDAAAATTRHYRVVRNAHLLVGVRWEGFRRLGHSKRRASWPDRGVRCRLGLVDLASAKGQLGARHVGMAKAFRSRWR